MVDEALPILPFSSKSRFRLLEMTEPRLVKSSNTSRELSPMEMLGAGLTFWPRTFVFLILIVRPNSLQASEKQFLQPSLCVRSKCSVVRKQHLADQNFSHLGLCTEAREVEQAAIAPGVYVDALFISLEGISQQQREQNAEKRRRKDTALFYSTLDREGFRGGPVELNSVLHLSKYLFI